MNKKSMFCCKNYNIFNLLAPDYCYLCGRIGDSVCPECLKRLQKCCKNYNTWQNDFIGTDKSSAPELAELIKQFKYNSVFSLAQPLAEVLASFLPDQLDVVVVPAPTAPRHVRLRGLDHTKKLARRLAHLKGWRHQRLLIRTSNSVQVGSDAKTRTRQANQAYRISPRAKIDASKIYLVIDDVTTTGASIAACRTALKKAGAQTVSTAVLIKS